MPIDAVNSAMTPLQFASARAASRAVETSAELSARGGNGRAYGRSTPPPASPVISTPAHYYLPPVTFHWSYRLARVNGKHVAKPTPQFADTSFWSIAINRLG